VKLEESWVFDYKNIELKWILRPNEFLPEVSAQPAFQNTVSPFVPITLFKRTT